MKYYLLLINFLLIVDLHAGWKDLVSTVVDKKSTKVSTAGLEEKALKAALKQGTEYAVDSLGKKNGYLNDKKAKILLPENLRKTETVVQKSGGGKKIDDLIASMNTAATQAAPKTAKIFFKSIQNMNIEDAKKILKSEDDALSSYFKKSSYAELEILIKPIVKEMMDKNKVSYHYKKFRSYYEKNKDSMAYAKEMMGLAKSFGLDKYAPPKDLDVYVTHKAIDGLFIKISQEEKKIRENPLIQKSKLIRDVFGSI